MTTNRFSLITVFVFLTLSACSHQAIVPEGKNIKVQREPVSKDCQSLGTVQGSVTTAKGTFEQALEDLKLDAARKGANVVHIEATSGLGTSVSGTAYQCP